MTAKTKKKTKIVTTYCKSVLDPSLQSKCSAPHIEDALYKHGIISPRGSKPKRGKYENKDYLFNLHWE